MTFSTSFKTVNGAFRHFWWLMILITVLGVAGAAVTARQRQPTYQATATLNLDSTQSLGASFDTALQSDTFLSQRFIQLATSRAVLQQACTTTKIKGCDPVALARQVSASNSRATGLIDITVKSSSATNAAMLANAIVDEEVRQNKAQADGALAPTSTLLNDQLKQEDDKLQSIRGQISAVQRAGGTEGTVANNTAPLLADLNTTQSQYTATFNKLQDLNVQKSRLETLLSVQQRALPPTTPIDPNLPIYLAVGFAAGLLVGLLLALFAERLDDRIRDSGQLAEATGSQLVLEMPKPPGRRGEAEYQEREAASYALAHASMLVRQEGVRSVLVVAATLGDQVDDVGLGLARAAADFGDRVLVLQSSASGNGDGHGAREGSHRGSALERTSQVVVEAVAKEDVGRELTSADGFDLIIACTPPPGYSSNAMSIVTSTDLAVVVATRGRTRFRDARWASELLRHTGVPVAGAILRARTLVGGGVRSRPRLAPVRGQQPAAPPPTNGSSHSRVEPSDGNGLVVEPRRRGRI